MGNFILMDELVSEMNRWINFGKKIKRSVCLETS